MKFIKVIVFVLSCVLLFVFGAKINAQDTPPVPPNPVACDNVASPEFHSLRPYQKNSSCQSETADYATFCGNTLTLQETIEKTYVPGDPNCKTAGSKITCSYIEKVSPHSVTIDLSGANLPIMGNTEEVTNYKGEPDQKTDAEKVNEYVSWYLNGVNNRAEYISTEDGRKIIDFSGPINKLLPEKIQRKARVATIEKGGDTRHDQIVGCVYNLLGLFKVGQIVECYPKTIDKSYMRLSDWEKNNHIPPDEEDKAFNSYSDYLIALKRWRGESCITLSGISLCFDNPLKPNYWGNLFQNIPLSSTEDLKGNIKVNPFSAGGAGVTNISFDNQSPATLFFSHIQESDELGSILQDTYISKDQQKKGKTGPDTAVSFPSSCTTVDVRSNKGDSLFAGEIGGKLSYTASFSCDFDYLYCSTENNKDCAYGCIPDVSGGTCIMYGQTRPETVPQKCSKTINIALSTQSNTPKIDDVWSRLVGGPTAVVKRMFPKLGTQIGTLKDIPGSTSISYDGAGASSGELNLPHIGGISEYFLKGIQTLLRPKGYGEPISFGETTATLGGNCDGSVFEKYNPPSQTINKATDYFNAYIKPDLTDEVVSVYKEAEKQTGIPCEVFAGLHYIEGGNKPNSSLISGRPLGTPEPDEGYKVFTTLLDTAVYVAGRIKDKVGGDVSTWEKLVTALSRYNGGGNRNCQPNFSGGDIPYLDLPGRCPPSYEGEDDPYALSWIDKKHSQMYLLYCADFTACLPQELIRPGIMTVATDFYLAKKKGW